MPSNPEKPKRCKHVPGTQFVMEGWGCCQCQTYNGKQRAECKNCVHKRCDHKAENQAS